MDWVFVVTGVNASERHPRNSDRTHVTDEDGAGAGPSGQVRSPTDLRFPNWQTRTVHQGCSRAHRL